jgi:hypothetical protein
LSIWLNHVFLELPYIVMKTYAQFFVLIATEKLTILFNCEPVIWIFSLLCYYGFALILSVFHDLPVQADYINTSHPSFIGGSKAVEQAQQQVRTARLPITVVRRVRIFYWTLYIVISSVLTLWPTLVELLPSRTHVHTGKNHCSAITLIAVPCKRTLYLKISTASVS